MTITVKRTEEKTSVPCGKCPKCLSRRISGWSFRLMREFEAPHTESGHFVTLTYDTAHVPITDNGFMSVQKRDCQLFFKRLRKAHPPNSNIRYYLAAEYGGKTKRPHYHAIMFNVNRELIQPAWALGSVHYGTLTVASVGYTLKYMCKPKRIPAHRNDDRVPEFSLMSKSWVHLI